MNAVMQNLPRWKKPIAWALIAVAWPFYVGAVCFLSAKRKIRHIRRERQRREIYGSR